MDNSFLMYSSRNVEARSAILLLPVQSKIVNYTLQKLSFLYLVQCSLFDTKARFPLGDFFRAKRLFPLSASLITSANAMPTKEKVASREKSRLVENGLNRYKYMTYFCLFLCHEKLQSFRSGKDSFPTAKLT